MNCEESKNLITISVYGKLTPTEKAQLEAHLQECSKCASIFEKSEKLSSLVDEKEDIPLPDKEKSWQIISDKAVKRKGGWLESLVPQKPVFQFSFALLLLVVGFAAGYFIRSGWQRGGEITQLRQEVRQIRQIAAVSLLRQESLREQMREIGSSFQVELPDEETLADFLQRVDSDRAFDALSIFSESPMAREEFARSLSERASPLMEIALVFTQHVKDF
jgi:anti-sigma factor RsiW